MDNEIPIDPSATLFPMEDIAKSFTAAAVLQLSERGAVDLDADVNLYLNDFMLRSVFRPLTLRNILTHTSGFAESSIGAYALEAEDIKPQKITWLTFHPGFILRVKQVPMEIMDMG